MPIRNPYQKQCSPRHHNNKQTPQAIIDGKENKTGESRTSKKRSWIGQQQHQPSLRNAPQFSLPSLLSPSWSTTGKGSTSIISDPNPQIPSNNPIILPLKQLPTMECDQSELIVDEADPFACDIDWDEAERTFLDKMHMHDRTVKNNDRKYKSTLGPRVQHQPTIVQPSINNQSNRSSSSKSECQRASMGGLRTDGGTTTNHHTACTPVGEAPCSSTGATKNSTASTEATWWSASDALLQESLPPPLRFSPDMVKPIDDELRTSLVQNASLNQPLQNGWHLYGHQKRAILRGLVMRRMILALDMGLGKTLIGCVWAQAFCRTIPQLKVIVISPVSVQQEWNRTATEASGLRVTAASSRKLKPLPLSVRDSTDIEHDSEGSQVLITTWAKVPSSSLVGGSPYVVVADEAHSMQSTESLRTKSALSLMLDERCIGVLLLTGTPMKNGKPSNLFPLLKAVKHPLGRHQRAYEVHFCAGHDVHVGGGKTIWAAAGSSNVSQLRALCRSHLLHLTKEDCLKDLPPQTRVVHKVPVSSRRQIEFDRAIQDLAKIYGSNSGSTLSQQDRIERNNEAVLGAIQRLRMVGSLSKIEGAVHLASNILQDEPAVVVFTSFCEVAKTVHRQMEEAGWKGELLTGETPARKRQDMVDRFQEGLSSVFVCTFGAGGVGLTLTAAHTIILIDRPWTPGDAYQAEDRVRRIGQTQPVRSIWMSSFPIDEQIDRLLEEKTQTTKAVLAGKDVGDTLYHQSIVPRILKAVLSSNTATHQQRLDSFVFPKPIL